MRRRSGTTAIARPMLDVPRAPEGVAHGALPRARQPRRALRVRPRRVPRGRARRHPRRGREVTRTKNDHNTPEIVLKVIRAYSPIGLDPCSNPWSTVGAVAARSKHDGQDGLTSDWSEYLDEGIVYVNPPYGSGLILPWVEKAAEEAQRGVETLMLVPCSPETRWARAAHAACSAWGPWARRIAFEGAGGAGMKGPSALYHFGPHRFLFA